MNAAKTETTTNPHADQTNTGKFKNFKDFMSKVEAMGVKEADGQLQRPEFAKSVVIAAQEGHITSTDEAKAIWAKFREKALTKLENNVPVMKEESNTAARVSDLKKLIEAGLNKYIDFSEVLMLATPLICKEAKAAGKVKGNMWDNFLKLARYQQKKENFQKQMTKDEIMKVLLPEDNDNSGADKWNELALLEDLHKRGDRILNGTKGTPEHAPKEGFHSKELVKALDLITNRIEELRKMNVLAKQAEERRKLGIAA